MTIPFRTVIVARIAPGTHQKVADVFDYYDNSTRPQDFGVIGRRLLSLDDLYIHLVERKEDPAVSGQTRGLPAFQKITEIICQYVTPYQKNWRNPSDSVAKEFYRWVPAETVSGEPTDERHLTVIVGRIKPGAEPNVARIFADSDAGPLPVEMQVTGRWLYSSEDVYVHLLERSVPPSADDARIHQTPKFGDIMAELSPYIGPYAPGDWRDHRDAVARQFYRWQAVD
ncbi:TcmI family type II polyketide cyclase [Solwaraspora sp. WMMB335]|uniref:TcmI family type II polyketide cyclase n=1 Tax=Solwaraspora sp. WMMB335 TaxID=3404118 RepID=UPI003B933B3A